MLLYIDLIASLTLINVSGIQLHSLSKLVLVIHQGRSFTCQGFLQNASRVDLDVSIQISYFADYTKFFGEDPL